MWSASAISRSTWTSAGHGDSDRLIGEPENHLSYPANSNPAVLPHSPANAAGAPAYSFVFALHQMSSVSDLAKQSTYFVIVYGYLVLLLVLPPRLPGGW